MFARIVTTHVKPGNFDLLTRKFEEKVIPMLRKQPGFRDEVSFYDADKSESFAISFWDSEADERKYAKEIYPELLKTLSDTFVETPLVRRFEVANSTMYKIRAN
ncbi:MAG TPA: antibiotic biosynthesis monooxygenase [Steroidobacteraceae bacterium]|jgi:heme-degrading monooxygenase HmoA|nr:antibiotic biosynthesis monooxygenase [Steroidobacteraceae bacterium]